MIPVVYVLVSIIAATIKGPVDDSDLIYTPQVIDDRENAYLILLPVLKEIKEQKPYDEVESLLNNEKDFDYKKANDVIHKYSPFLRVLSDALELNSFQVPFQRSLHETKKKTYAFQSLFLQKLMTVYIRTLINEEDFVDASNEILKLLKYGYLLQNSDGGLIYYMVSVLSKERAFELLQELVVRSNFNIGQYEKLMSEIEKYADNGGTINNLKIEYTAAADTLRCFDKGCIDYEQGNIETYYPSWFLRLRMIYIYDENATLKELAELFRQEIKNIKGQYVDIEHKKIILPSNPILKYLYLFSGNPTGKLLLALVTPRYGDKIERTFKLDTISNLTKLLLAIKAYQIDTNSIPNNLYELVPTYISSIPKDPYDNKDLRYSKSDKVIYSVYSDMKDDMGDEEKDLCINLNIL